MRKILLITLVVIVVLIAGFVGVVAMQPADFRISRSATIDAPPAEVFAQVNDFHNWQPWSPWAKIDPQAKISYEFTFKKADFNKTTATWSMYGQNGFVSKAFCLFINMDRMLGGEFEKGLASMKSVVEAKQEK